MPEPLNRYKFLFKPGPNNPDKFEIEARSLQEAISRLWLRSFKLDTIKSAEVFDGKEGWQLIDSENLTSVIEELKAKNDPFS